MKEIKIQLCNLYPYRRQYYWNCEKLIKGQIWNALPELRLFKRQINNDRREKRIFKERKMKT